MIPYTMINQKGTSKKIILGLYVPYTVINQKGTSNNFMLENKCNKQAHSKTYNHSMYTKIYYKKNVLFFFTVYKNEWKEYKF